MVAIMEFGERVGKKTREQAEKHCRVSEIGQFINGEIQDGIFEGRNEHDAN